MRFIKYIGILLWSLLVLSCTRAFDMQISDDPVIFIESFPGVDEMVVFEILPAYSVSNSALKPEFRPEIVFTVNGREVPVVRNTGHCVSERYAESYYIADYKAVPGDKMRVEVSSEGFDSVYAETVIPEPFPQRRVDFRTETVGEYRMNILYVKPDNAGKQYGYALQIYNESVVDFTDSVAVYPSIYIGGQISDFYDMAPESMEGMEVEFGGKKMAVWKSDVDQLQMVINGYSYDPEAVYESFFVNVEDRQDYTLTSRNKLLLYTLSEEFYKYIVAQELIDSNAGFVAGLAPSNFCYSNVKGGYGAFAGLTAVETDWITKEFIENNR
ncbi:MAG: DUF4249 family protein [Bacteroidales bacterium]|nr:DUF4249 family protein [Bacteroidales bacterium]